MFKINLATTRHLKAFFLSWSNVAKDKFHDFGSSNCFLQNWNAYAWKKFVHLWGTCSCKQKQPPEVFYKKAVFRNFAIFTEKHECQSLLLIKFYEKETLTQVFSCEYCELSKNTYFEERLQMTASVLVKDTVRSFNIFHLNQNSLKTIFVIMETYISIDSL